MNKQAFCNIILSSAHCPEVSKPLLSKETIECLEVLTVPAIGPVAVRGRKRKGRVNKRQKEGSGRREEGKEREREA
jgi:hypothetical protein